MMLNDSIIIQLIEKIRNCPFLKKYSNILERTPNINVNFVEDKGIELYNICFNDWDEIRISNTEVVFYPENASRSWPPPREVLLSYKNWEELCTILNININNADEDELLPFICVCGRKFRQSTSKCRQISYPNGEILCYAKCPRCGKEPETRWK